MGKKQTNPGLSRRDFRFMARARRPRRRNYKPDAQANANLSPKPNNKQRGGFVREALRPIGSDAVQLLPKARQDGLTEADLKVSFGW